MPNLHHNPRTRAFTLTELLVVIAIVVLLLGTLFVAINAASKRAQVAKTQFLMNTISSGLAQFNTDFGYLPPVLGRKDGSAPASGFARDVVRFNDVANQQNWYSYTTLADYLLGYGHRGEDGYGIQRVNGAASGQISEPGFKEAPPFGIRSPGADGCWGAIDAPQPNLVNFKGYYRARNPARAALPPPVTGTGWNAQVVEGRVYGPYIDQIDERLLGGLTGFDASGRPIILTRDQLGTTTAVDFDALPKCILDYWGEPIAYYRTPYGGDDLRSNVPATDGGYLDLGDVFCLREWEIDSSEQSAGAVDANGDNSSSASMKGAVFALLSRGGDRAYDRTVRRDASEFNKDNVVQAGK
jgi:prepilin-type N-terminal cleavage/methylation domain-containing protein